MSDVALSYLAPVHNDRFYWRVSVAMALFVIAGFSLNLALGRSTFAAPLIVHLHAFAFMGWVVLFILQSGFATHGHTQYHRRLGWLGAVWVLALVGLGIAVTIDRMQRGSTPFFFRPQEFLLANSLGIIAFAGLTWTAIRMRRRPDWHRRLQIGALASIMGPAFGRLLPMPFLIPYAFEVAAIVGLIFPVAGMLRDWRSEGRVHPAWWVAISVTLIALLSANLLAHSSLGDALYAAVTEGTPGALVPGLAFPNAPPM